MGLEQAIRRGFRDKVPSLVSEAHRQLAGRELRLLQGKVDDRSSDLLGDAVPDPVWLGRAVLKDFGAAGLVQVAPPVERGARDPEPPQRSPGGQMGLLDQADDLQLLGGRIPHAPSSPSASMLFLSRRFSSVRSATTSFRALVSRRSAFTSSEVAARAVSPARRLLPASRNSLDQP